MNPPPHVLDAYAEVVSAFPERLALLDPLHKTQWTHAQLWAASLQVAGALRASKRVRSQDVVALDLGRSALHVIAMLGAWHLGATIVPLDTTWPEARRQRVLQQSAPACTIDRPTMLTLLEYDSHKPPPSSCRQTNTLAYILFTSGSTGDPKGVMIEHVGLVPLLHAQRDIFALHSTSRCLWVTSPSFDASISDIGTSLLSGACLVIGQDAHPARVWEAIQRHNITHLDYPPSLLGRLPKEDSTLETMIVGGEVCEVAVVHEWATRVRLVNVYGPTEATICVSAEVCSSTWPSASLGHALANMSLHVLDHNDAPCPEGQRGHLHISGAGLARGYLQDPIRTAERFVTIDGVRMYRTGDRAIRHGDRFEFAGRLDRQVKLRGLRIELDDLEHHLRGIEGVEQVCAIKRPINANTQGLVAFLEGTTHHSTSTLRAHMAQHLPPWMIPSRWIWLNALPRNAAQKIDARALTTMSLPPQKPNASHAHDQTIDTLCAIWADVLMTKVQPHDDLFALGASSLDIIEVVDAAHQHNILTSPQLWMSADSVAHAWDMVSGTMEDREDGARHHVNMVPGTIASHTHAPWLEEQARALGLRPWKHGHEEHTPQHIFLTGGTGQLGRALVTQWMQDETLDVSVLIRATDHTHAHQRARALWGELAESPRLHVYVGDVTKARFGQDSGSWNRLCTQTDTIVHSAARVNMLHDFEALRATNLDALCHVVDLACAVRPKALHHISTLSVFVATDRNTGIAREDDLLTHTNHVYGGYAQTKWAAERALIPLQQAGAPLWIHRLGLVTNLEAPSDHNFLATFVQGIAHEGTAPTVEGDDVAVDITSQTDAVRILTKLIRHAPCAIYHIASAQNVSLRRLLMLMQQSNMVQLIDAPSWAMSHEETRHHTSSVRLAMARLTQPSAEGWDAWRTMDLFQATDIDFDMTHTLNAIPHDPGVGSPSDDALIQWMMRCVQE